VSFLTVADGLVDDRVVDLLEDRDGILWIATLGGISRFDGNQFRHFTLADGLPNTVVLQPRTAQFI
jgi:ligand-binding sensor domain-containing protein